MREEFGETCARVVCLAAVTHALLGCGAPYRTVTQTKDDFAEKLAVMSPLQRAEYFEQSLRIVAIWNDAEVPLAPFGKDGVGMFHRPLAFEGRPIFVPSNQIKPRCDSPSEDCRDLSSDDRWERLHGALKGRSANAALHGLCQHLGYEQSVGYYPNYDDSLRVDKVNILTPSAGTGNQLLDQPAVIPYLTSALPLPLLVSLGLRVDDNSEIPASRPLRVGQLRRDLRRGLYHAGSHIPYDAPVPWEYGVTWVASGMGEEVLQWSPSGPIEVILLASKCEDIAGRLKCEPLVTTPKTMWPKPLLKKWAAVNILLCTNASPRAVALARGSFATRDGAGLLDKLQPALVALEQGEDDRAFLALCNEVALSKTQPSVLREAAKAVAFLLKHDPERVPIWDLERDCEYGFSEAPPPKACSFNNEVMQACQRVSGLRKAATDQGDTVDKRWIALVRDTLTKRCVVRSEACTKWWADRRSLGPRCLAALGQKTAAANARAKKCEAGSVPCCSKCGGWLDRGRCMIPGGAKQQCFLDCRPRECD